MIAVIADDFTGAAELAGIGLRYGLQVSLFSGMATAGNAGLVIVNTDSRSVSEQNACAATEKAVLSVQKLQPAFIYKKTDSVLRGHVLAELQVQMRLQETQKAFLLPANPSLGRTIRDEQYFIDAQPIHNTGFGNDPEFPIKSAFIRDMLRAGADDTITVTKPGSPIPDLGITVGEAVSETDTTAWAHAVNQQSLLAGGGDFFEALLQLSFSKNRQALPPVLHKPVLYISGTAFEQSVALVKSIAAANDTVHYLSNELTLEQSDEEWYTRVIGSLQKHSKAVIAIGGSTPQTLTALQMRTRMAAIVQTLLQKVSVPEIIIEGGSTAAAIFNTLAVHDFFPTHELSRGVIRMKAADKEQYFTVKPGSYTLSTAIKELFLNTYQPTQHEPPASH